MKRWLILCLILLALTLPALAAGWPEGTGPARPYPRLTEADLEAEFGYWVGYPHERLPAQTFCDTLRLYLPREDVALAAGTLTLEEEGGATLAAEVSEAGTLRMMSEAELNALEWGGGACLEIRLPVSLRMNARYQARLTEGALVTASGVPSPALEGWTPRLEGDYGIGGLRWCADGAEEIRSPQIGDTLRFDLTLGGSAASAVVYTETDCIRFDELEFHESREVTGEVTDAALNWGVIFFDQDGAILRQLTLKSE